MIHKMKTEVTNESIYKLIYIRGREKKEIKFANQMVKYIRNIAN